MPTPALKKEDDHELQRLSPIPGMLLQATAYFEARVKAGGGASATDLGAEIPPLCKAVADSSVTPIPVNSMAPTPAEWSPAPTPSQSRATSPRSCEEAANTQEQLLTSGIRKLPDSTVVLEPLWYNTRSIIWLLGVRRHVLETENLTEGTSLRHHLPEALRIARHEIGQLIRLVEDDDAGKESWTLVRAPWSDPGFVDDRFPQSQDVCESALTATLGSTSLEATFKLFVADR